MAATAAPLSPAAHEDDRRARELFHYFQPENPALLPAACAASGKPADAAISRKASPNLVLTALTQLAALKLGVQRAIISLIDRETLYVVAEASRTLRLGNTDVFEEDGDGLWMGCAHGPVAGTLCEKTITLKSTPENANPLFIVEDLREHPVYRNIPCVAGPPHFRYYAGTPLTTSNGITIGSLYIIDPRPDLKLTAAGQEILGSIANAVMEYLETSRQSLDGSRLAKVLSGLNTFVQGEAELDNTSNPFYKESIPSDRASSHGASDRHSPESEASATNLSDTVNTYFLEPQRSEAEVHEIDHGKPDSPVSISQSDRGIHPQTAASWPAEQHSSPIHPAFQRAADIMLESLDLGSDGGVAIFDSHERFEVEKQETSDHEKEQQLARVCGISVKDKTIREWARHGSHSSGEFQLDVHFMHRMLRRYPRGGFWYFHHDGTAFSSDEDATSSGSERGRPASIEASQHTLQPLSRKPLRERDLQKLRRCFPLASRIIFTPLWDSLNSQWFGGCFCWSGVESRVFSSHVELGGIFGFGSSLMVEYSRAQSQESDRKKGDFISSISHELRSPLHGILAATGFLYDQIDPEFARSMLDTIRSCGQTLLDTFEQILDFTKINAFEKKRHGSGSLSRSRGERNHDKADPRSLHIVKFVDVAAVVEEVVESVYSGQIFSKSMASRDGNFELSKGGNLANDTPVEVFIDIASHDWKFMLESGSLRRIVMNVFGNALKYTEKGSVSVRLELTKKYNASTSQPQSTAGGLEVLTLTVSDTGRGISNAYLKSNLFTPFSQEDPLAPGTGLGLSLVRSIVRSMKGTIKIKSQLGSGTVVTISLPLSRHQPAENNNNTQVGTERVLQETTDYIIRRLIPHLKGKSLSTIFDDENHMAKQSSLQTVENYLTGWFCLEQKPWHSKSVPDFVLIHENQLDRLAEAQGPSIVISLCHREPALRSNKTRLNEQIKVVWIPLPCGPHRLARALFDVVSGTHNQQSEASRTLVNAPEPNLAVPSTPLSTQTTISSKVTIDTKNESLLVLDIQRQFHQSNAQVLPDDSHDGLRILLVEDNAINLALLRKFVARLEPKVLDAAMNGKLAVDKVKSSTEGYHYIFMDMSMPVMDGFEATQAIRFIERDRRTVSPAIIIALTGLGASEHIKRAYAAGVNVFLTKPVSFKDIELVMKQHKISPASG